MECSRLRLHSAQTQDVYEGDRRKMLNVHMLSSCNAALQHERAISITWKRQPQPSRTSRPT
eukprot:2303840-Amphidinium_carterae.2